MGMRNTATKITEIKIDGKSYYEVQWPKFLKGRNRQAFRQKTDAETFLKQKLAEQRNYGIAGSDFSLRDRAQYSECADRLAPFNATVRDAVDFYLPHLVALNRSCTAQQLVDEIIRAKTADGASARYINDLKNRLHHFAIAFDGKPVAKITTADIDEWLRNLTKRQGKVVAPTTRNNFRRLLIVAFNFAVNRGYCTANPVVKSAKAKAIETPVGILTVDETIRLIRNAPEELAPYVASVLSPGSGVLNLSVSIGRKSTWPRV
jgi:hypothetical protein